MPARTAYESEFRRFTRSSCLVSRSAALRNAIQAKLPLRTLAPSSLAEASVDSFTQA